MLKTIQIEGLFNRFDYNIDLKQDGLTILTGPNGYGKTTILRMIDSVASRNYSVFFEVPVKSLKFNLVDDFITIEHNKKSLLSILKKR
jgi:predicted ATP-binding protein involved in virulence